MNGVKIMRYIEGKPLLKLLLEQEDIAQLVAKYLTKAMETSGASMVPRDSRRRMPITKGKNKY